ncbi:MAG: hypothetical protein LBO79_07650 [Zoogloeaceae bacterium]|jgi:tetratricopeptide (TPR) repeat protein|nr:hypothetical protein [Zoogloeaceae bacterium]
MKKTGYAVRFLLLLGVIALLYWPGLRGGYLFDDEINILQNKRIAIETLDPATLRTAAWSGSAGPLKRPVSMLSFALNHYFTQFDPFWFKLVNLAIHLVNTLLVGALACLVLAGFARRHPPSASARENPDFPARGALIAAALWGIHPLNLTSVLYVVQRMTSLSALFGLAALASYGAWRLVSTRYTPCRSAGMAILVAFFLTASALSKESGLLFLPFLVFMELMVFQGLKQDGTPLRIGRLEYRRLVWLLFWAGVLVLLWKLPTFLRPENFHNRDFTLEERLMTEARVLFYYLRLFLAPTLSELAIWHDDFIISRNLWTPFTTALSLLGLTLVTALALRIHARHPAWRIVWFAWGWFLIAHAMESTVISLELVHEHRNYVATLGFAILVPWLIEVAGPRFSRFAFLLFGGVLSVFGFLTWQRAEIWARPSQHAAFEAQAHPDSDRANYQLGYVYAQEARIRQDPRLAALAVAQMRKAMRAYMPDNAPWFNTLFLASSRIPVDPEIVAQLRTRLKQQPFYNSNMMMLRVLADCQIAGTCRLSHQDAEGLFTAAIENPRAPPSARAMLYLLLATYHTGIHGDIERAEEFLKKAEAIQEDVATHLLFMEFYTNTGRLAEARQRLEKAIRMDKLGALRQRAEKGRRAIEAAERQSGNAGKHDGKEKNGDPP